MKIIALLSLFNSFLSIYTLAIYGHLDHWYRANRILGIALPSFSSNVDQVRLLATLIAASTAVTAFVIWKTKSVQQHFGIGLFLFSLLCLTLTVVIQF